MHVAGRPKASKRRAGAHPQHACATECADAHASPFCSCLPASGTHCFRLVLPRSRPLHVAGPLSWSPSRTMVISGFIGMCASVHSRRCAACYVRWPLTRAVFVRCACRGRSRGSAGKSTVVVRDFVYVRLLCARPRSVIHVIQASCKMSPCTDDGLLHLKNHHYASYN